VLRCQIVLFTLQRRLFYSVVILFRDGGHGFPGGRSVELDAAFRSATQVEPQGQHHSGKQQRRKSKYCSTLWHYQYCKVYSTVNFTFDE
jgi:hypothetical protein